MTEAHELAAELRSVREELEGQRAIAGRVMASYQQRALQMEVIRQQNEDLDKLAAELAVANRNVEERSRQLEEAARLKSEFLANFSHEIRTPLNAILGYCDLLAREEGARLTPHGRRDLNVIKNNARTLLELINDILDLSKIEAGRVDVVVEAVDLQALADDCVATVRDIVKGRDVLISAQVDPLAAEIQSDGLKVRQVLLNLLSNAAKFTDQGEIQLTVAAQGSSVCITVDDTGVGIPNDQLGHIFEKFRQVDGSSTRRAGGTGLGLAIVREVVHVLGGSVEVESTVGRGSRFIVLLPNALGSNAGGPANAVRAAPVEWNPRETEVASVLVVDDDPVVVELLKHALTDEGFEVLTARDGVSALQIARERRPTAIMLDLRLPRLDGWSVLSTLKADAAVSHIPVVIISIEEERAKGFSFGACEYLVKPVEPERFLQAVKKATGVAPKGEILVVDDDADTRALVVRQLRGAGFSCGEAANGEEALLKIRVVNPALVVLDLVMPKLNGFDVLASLRQSGSTVPVIVLTGRSLKPAEEELLRSRLAHVVQKGGTALDGVVTQARELLSKHRAERRQLRRVLYVEDAAQNRDIVRRYLQGEYEVLEAEDGEHGVERARRDKPDLILMDLSLPRIDGWEATRRIKADLDVRHIPVIALTAHASRSDQDRAREAGCDDYLTKPIERSALMSTIEKHLRSRANAG